MPDELGGRFRSVLEDIEQEREPKEWWPKTGEEMVNYAGRDKVRELVSQGLQARSQGDAALSRSGVKELGVYRRTSAEERDRIFNSLLTEYRAEEERQQDIANERAMQRRLNRDRIDEYHKRGIENLGRDFSLSNLADTIGQVAAGASNILPGEQVTQDVPEGWELDDQRMAGYLDETYGGMFDKAGGRQGLEDLDAWVSGEGELTDAGEGLLLVAMDPWLARAKDRKAMMRGMRPFRDLKDPELDLLLALGDAQRKEVGSMVEGPETAYQPPPWFEEDRGFISSVRAGLVRGTVSLLASVQNAGEIFLRHGAVKARQMLDKAEGPDPWLQPVHDDPRNRRLQKEQDRAFVLESELHGDKALEVAETHPWMRRRGSARMDFNLYRRLSDPALIGGEVADTLPQQAATLALTASGSPAASVAMNFGLEFHDIARSAAESGVGLDRAMATAVAGAGVNALIEQVSSYVELGLFGAADDAAIKTFQSRLGDAFRASMMGFVTEGSEEFFQGKVSGIAESVGLELPVDKARQMEEELNSFMIGGITGFLMSGGARLVSSTAAYHGFKRGLPDMSNADLSLMAEIAAQARRDMYLADLDTEDAPYDMRVAVEDARRRARSLDPESVAEVEALVRGEMERRIEADEGEQAELTVLKDAEGRLERGELVWDDVRDVPAEEQALRDRALEKTREGEELTGEEESALSRARSRHRLLVAATPEEAAAMGEDDFAAWVHSRLQPAAEPGKRTGAARPVQLLTGETVEVSDLTDGLEGVEANMRDIGRAFATRFEGDAANLREGRQMLEEFQAHPPDEGLNMNQREAWPDAFNPALDMIDAALDETESPVEAAEQPQSADVETPAPTPPEQAEQAVPAPESVQERQPAEAIESVEPPSPERPSEQAAEPPQPNIEQALEDGRIDEPTANALRTVLQRDPDAGIEINEGDPDGDIGDGIVVTTSAQGHLRDSLSMMGIDVRSRGTEQVQESPQEAQKGADLKQTPVEAQEGVAQGVPPGDQPLVPDAAEEQVQEPRAAEEQVQAPPQEAQKGADLKQPSVEAQIEQAVQERGLDPEAAETLRTLYRAYPGAEMDTALEVTGQARRGTEAMAQAMGYDPATDTRVEATLRSGMREAGVRFIMQVNEGATPHAIRHEFGHRGYMLLSDQERAAFDAWAQDRAPDMAPQEYFAERFAAWVEGRQPVAGRIESGSRRLLDMLRAFVGATDDTRLEEFFEERFAPEVEEARAIRDAEPGAEPLVSDAAQEQIQRTEMDESIEQLPQTLKENLSREELETFVKDAQTLRDLLGGNTARIGVDPRVIEVGSRMGYTLVKAGVRKFGGWARQMVDAIGPSVKPYLSSIYMFVRSDPDARQYRAEMDSADTVEGLTPDEIDAIIGEEEVGDGQSDIQSAGQPDARGIRGPESVGAESASPHGGPSAEADGGTEGGRAGQAEASRRGEGAQRSEAVPEAAGEGLGQGEGTELRGERTHRAPGHRRDGKRFGNYIIRPDDAPERMGPKTRTRANIEAIRLLQKLDRENRRATPEEKEILAKYSGWGAVRQQMFSDNPTYQRRWAAEREALAELVTGEQLDEFAQSSVTAFYTSVPVASGMWAALERLGIEGGPMLEPSAGAGMFLGTMPQGLRGKVPSIQTAEIDQISYDILSRLYPDADHNYRPFQDVFLPPHSLGLAVGNVPFLEARITDRHERSLTDYHLYLHDFMFAKTLRAMRPGGVLAFITTHGSLDKRKGSGRPAWINEGADFVGAVRLPNTAFKQNADTRVVADIIVLQKRVPGEQPKGPAFSRSTEVEIEGHSFNVNEYFQAHPEMVLGEQTAQGSQYRANEYTVEGSADNLHNQIAEKLGSLELPWAQDVYKRADIDSETVLPDPKMLRRRVPDTTGAEQMALVVQDGRVWRKWGEDLYAMQTPGNWKTETFRSRVEGVVEVRDAAQRLIELESDPIAEEADVAAARQQLNDVYDAFVEEFGNVTSPFNMTWTGMEHDPASGLLASLETELGDSNEVEKAEIFERRTTWPHLPTGQVDSADAALVASMRDAGGADVEYMQDIYDVDRDTLLAELGNKVFETPDGDVVLREEYLSGNVRQKLRRAREAAENNPLMRENVKALEEVLPPDRTPEQIKADIGAGWIDTGDYEAFLREELGVDAKLTYTQSNGEYNVYDMHVREPHLAHDRWGAMHEVEAMGELRAKGRHAGWIFRQVIQNGDLTVTETQQGHRVVDTKATEMAKVKAQAMKERFARWLFETGHRRRKYVERYNEKFNSYVHTRVTGEHYMGEGAVPGMNRDIQLYPHQARALWRGLIGGNQYYAHVVGSGKTLLLAALAMEKKRLGLARKTAITVPKYLIGQWEDEVRWAFPGAKVLSAGKGRFDLSKRKAFLSRVRTGNWDMILIPDSTFTAMPMSDEAIESFFQHEIDLLRAELEQQDDDRTVRDIQVQIERLREKMREQLQGAQTQMELPRFDELGIDSLMVDEAQNFKNMWYRTRQQRVPGVDTSEAGKAFDMVMKTDWLNAKTNYRNVVFASGTPITKSISEIWRIQRYLQPDILREQDVSAFDAWSRVYAIKRRQFGNHPVTGDLRLENRMNGLKATESDDLYNTISMFMDVVRPPDLVDADGEPYMDIPALKGGGPQAITVPAHDGMQDMAHNWLHRHDQLRNGVGQRVVTMSGETHEDNFLIIFGESRAASVDPRLVDSSLPRPPNGKVNTMAEKVVDIYHQHEDDRALQLIWCDYGTPDGKSFPLYEDIKSALVERGIPADEIAFAHDPNNDQQAVRLYERANEGAIRVLIGSTGKMSTGVNVQQRLIASHEIDVPFNPSDLEQRMGRMRRQGNMFDTVENYRYVMEAAGDAVSWAIQERKTRLIVDFLQGTAEGEVDLGDDDIAAVGMLRAQASGDPRMMEFMELRERVRELRMMREAHESSRYRMAQIRQRNPQLISGAQEQLAQYESDLAYSQQLAEQVTEARDWYSLFTIDGNNEWESRQELAERIDESVQAMRVARHGRRVKVGTVGEFDLVVEAGVGTEDVDIQLNRRSVTSGPKGVSAEGTLSRIINRLDPSTFQREVDALRENIADLQDGLENARQDEDRPWGREEELGQAESELLELQSELTGSDEELERLHAGPKPPSMEAYTPTRDDYVPGQDEVIPPEPKARIEAAENRSHESESFMQRLKGNLVALGHAMSRTRMHLPNDAEYAPARELLRLRDAALYASSERAIRHVAQVMEPLGPNQARDFAHFVLADALRANRDYGEPLRFGFENWDDVDAWYRSLREKIYSPITGDTDPRVARYRLALREALRRRRKMMNDLVSQLVEKGILQVEALERAPHYFHQMVLEYYDSNRPVSSAGIQIRKRSFQKHRVQGRALDMDYNTNYMESEVAWVTEALQSLADRVTWDQLEEHYGLDPRNLRREARMRNQQEIVYRQMRGNERYAEIETPEDAWAYREGLRRDLAQLRDERNAARRAGDPTAAMDEAISRALAELNEIDPLYSYQSEIGRHMAMLEAYAKADHSQIPAPLLRMMDAAEWSPDDERYWSAVAQIANLDIDDRAVSAARGLFKAISGRRVGILKILEGDALTAEDIANEQDYYGVQPEPGSQWYTALALSDQAAEALQADLVDGDEAGSGAITITQQDVREVMVMGGAKRTIFVPKPLHDELVSMEVPGAGKWRTADKMWTEALRKWKVWTLLNPKRVLPYNLRNMTGDISPVVATAPGALNYALESAQILWDYQRGKPTDYDDLLDRALTLGVISSNMVAQELDDIMGTKLFKRFLRGDVSEGLIARYWNAAKDFNEWRENILRLAAFRYALDRYAAGEDLKHYGGALARNMETLRAEMGDEVAAAHWARNLLGDYGNLSVMGQYLRQHTIPFYSWMEINARRTPMLAINSVRAGMRGRGLAAGAVWSALLTARVAWLYAAVSMWNLTFFPDLEDELPEYDRANPHLILGRNEDGTIRVFRNVGAVGDFAEWFGINALLSKHDKVRNGQLTWADLADEVYTAAPNKVIWGLHPAVQGSFGVLAQEKLWPDPWNTRYVRRDEAVADVFGLRDEYKAVRGAVGQTGEHARPHYAQRLLVGVVNPGRAAVADTYGLIDDWRKSTGTEGRSGSWSGESRIRTMRAAVYHDNYEAFADARKRFLERGLTYDDFRESLGYLDPVGPRLNKEDTEQFYEWLTPEQAKKVARARSHAGEAVVRAWRWWERAEEDLPSDEYHEQVAQEISRKLHAASQDVPEPGENPELRTKRLEAQREWSNWALQREIDPLRAVDAYDDYVRGRFTREDTIRKYQNRARALLRRLRADLQQREE